MTQFAIHILRFMKQRQFFHVNGMITGVIFRVGVITARHESSIVRIDGAFGFTDALMVKFASVVGPSCPFADHGVTVTVPDEAVVTASSYVSDHYCKKNFQ